MGFDPEAELDTITSGLEGFQSPAPHKAQNAHSRQGYMPHTKGPLSRAASGQTSSERTMSGAASRQVSIYPEMEHSLVAPEHLYNPAHHPSPRLTAALLRALSTPKAMSAARALSMLYPGLERPEVIEQLQQQSDKHAASPERRGSEWLSYPGMERGMSTSSHQGAPRQSQQQLSQQSQHTQQQQAQQQHAQHAGSMNRQPSDWLSYPGLERGFSVQSRRQQQQQPRSYALSSAESIRRKASGSVSDSESEQCASAQHKSAQQQLISAFAYAAAMPMSREPSGQFSYPGMERGFSGARHMATSPQQQPQQPPLQGHQARAASMQRNASDWLSYPGMERGLSTQQPKQPAQPTQQPTPPAQQPRAASMQRNPSDWLSYPGMERGLSRNLAQTRHQSPQRHPRQLSPLKPQAERAQAERAASMQRSPSDWLSYPGMERGLSMHPQQPQAAPSAAQPRSNAPLSRKASEWLSYPGMERGLSTQLPQSRLHQALCLETSYSIRSNASDSMWPGLEQCLEMSSNPSHSRLCQALCLESAPSVSSHYSDCDWPGLEADFDCSRSPSPDARLRDALCLESAASMRSNVSDCYYPGLERVMSMQSAAPALQRLLSIGQSCLTDPHCVTFLHCLTPLHLSMSCSHCCWMACQISQLRGCAGATECPSATKPPCPACNTFCIYICIYKTKDAG